MSRVLPLFPLSTVLFPGQVLPLHIFEERYRTLVADLLAADQRGDGDASEFGVVAIRHGHEPDSLRRRAWYDVGCVARVLQVTELPDGRYNIVTTGTNRFRLVTMADSGPYLRAEVDDLDDQDDADELDESSGDLDRELVQQVRDRFERYLHLVRDDLVDEILDAIPTDAQNLAYLVAGTMALPLPERQRLLEAADTASRLHLELDLLAREHTLIRALGTLPATDLTRRGFSLN